MRTACSIMSSVHFYTAAWGEKRYRISYQRPDCKQTTERGFMRRRDAEKCLADVEVSKHRGKYIAPLDGQPRIEELGQNWLAA